MLRSLSSVLGLWPLLSSALRQLLCCFCDPIFQVGKACPGYTVTHRDPARLNQAIQGSLQRLALEAAQSCGPPTACCWQESCPAGAPPALPALLQTKLARPSVSLTTIARTAHRACHCCENPALLSLLPPDEGPSPGFMPGAYL